jgi:hypothetical protein
MFKNTHILLLSIFAATIFMIVGFINYLLISDILKKYLKEVPILEKKTVPVVLHGLSGFMSIFIVLFLEKHLHSKFKIMKHPYIDALGVIVGTILIILSYKIYNEFDL